MDASNQAHDLAQPPLKSLCEIELESFHAGPAPFSGPLAQIKLEPMPSLHLVENKNISLDGVWLLTEENPDGLLDWERSISARVPGSVHTALFEAGRIPDPIFGRNQIIARDASYKTWFYKKEFNLSQIPPRARLAFDGVAYSCTVWLNGTILGSHEGSFGGPFYEVSHLLKSHNELIVKLDPIPQELDLSDINPHNNRSWKKTVVIINAYGWHYSCMPSLGIWNSVKIHTRPDIEVVHPFIAALDHETGKAGLHAEVQSNVGEWSGRLAVTVSPQNFDGRTYGFEIDLKTAGNKEIACEFKIPDVRLWYPNGMGEQNLYELHMRIIPEWGYSGGEYKTTFGVRTVRYEPLPGGPFPDKYNWIFVINGKRTFIKGTGFCTADAMLDLSRERYERLLRLAAIQNIQFLRAWGGGIPETDDFYDLCNELGIMVMQEWPTASDSHLTQPYEALEETVALNTLRIRNNPSLVMYCGGNESPNPFGKAIDMMGRLSVELDGTRPFHRTDPWGGSEHNYDTYWGRKHLDASVAMTSDIFVEFGIAAMPNIESVRRYLPPEEHGKWPAEPGSAFEYHTPVFGYRDDLSRLSQLAGYFVSMDCTLEQLVIASQLSQVVGVRHTLERSRTRWPDCAGAVYYKLNENFPAMCWSTIDWYGVPRIAHYVIQKSFAAVAAFVLPDTVSFTGTPQSMPVFFVNDSKEAGGYSVLVRVYDSSLTRLAEHRYTAAGQGPSCVGQLDIPYEHTISPPLFVTADVYKSDVKIFDTFYFFNCEADKGGIFNLPAGTLSYEASDGYVTIRNTGKLPCVAVSIECPGHMDRFTAWENFFWLEPNDSKRVRVDCTDGLKVSAWNAAPGA